MDKLLPNTALEKIPFIHPPSGVRPLDPNGGFPEREQAMLVVNIVLIVITSFFIGGRLYLNSTSKGRSIGWDDGTL